MLFMRLLYAYYMFIIIVDCVRCDDGYQRHVVRTKQPDQGDPISAHFNQHQVQVQELD